VIGFSCFRRRLALEIITSIRGESRLRRAPCIEPAWFEHEIRPGIEVGFAQQFVAPHIGARGEAAVIQVLDRPRQVTELPGRRRLRLAQPCIDGASESRGKMTSFAFVMATLKIVSALMSGASTFAEGVLGKATVGMIGGAGFGIMRASQTARSMAGSLSPSRSCFQTSK